MVTIYCGFTIINVNTCLSYSLKTSGKKLTLVQPRMVELRDRLPSPPEASSSIPQLEWVTMICLVVPTRVSRAKVPPSRKQNQNSKTS